MARTILFAVIPFLVSVVPALAIADNATDSAMAMPVVKVLSAVDIVEQVDGHPLRSSTVEVTLGPGVASMPHRHPGAVFGYVIEGEFEFKVEGKPKLTLKTGDTFYEPTMILHEVGRNPSDDNPTRVLAVIVHPRDATQLVIPEKTMETQAEKSDK